MVPKHVARRELLDHIARRLLVRLFEPHAAFFAAHGLAIADLALTAQDDRRLVHRAYEILRDHGAAAPQELCAVLAAIAALANVSGQAAIYRVCPALSAQRLGPKDAAATAALEYPEEFARVKRVAEPAAASQTEYDAVSDRAPIASDEAMAALSAALVAWLVEHGRTEKCVLYVHDRDDVLHVEIEHGRPPATDDVIGDELELTQVTLSRTERSHFVFVRGKGRLCVQASHAAIKDLLRRLVGEHLFGNPGHFRRDAAYTLAPLAANLDAALTFKDVPGVRAVALIGIEILTADERVRRERVGPGDLREAKHAHQLREMLIVGTVTWCKLRIEIEGRARPFVLEIAPAQKKLPPTAADVEAVVDEWLMARGLLAVRERRVVVNGVDGVDGAAAAAPDGEASDTGASA